MIVELIDTRFAGVAVKRPVGFYAQVATFMNMSLFLWNREHCPIETLDRSIDLMKSCAKQPNEARQARRAGVSPFGFVLCCGPAFVVS